MGGKRIMKLIGLDLGPNRTPFQNITDDEERALKAELEAIDFFNEMQVNFNATAFYLVTNKKRIALSFRHVL